MASVYSTLADAIGSLKKVNKNEVLVINLADENLGTAVIGAKKNGTKFRADLAEELAKLQLTQGAMELYDWGGVISLACPDEFAPPANTVLRPKPGTDRLVFSFTPWSDTKGGKVGGKDKLPAMATFARAAGFSGMVVMTKKQGTCGKADTFAALRASLRPEAEVTYYEDTYDVLKECLADTRDPFYDGAGAADTVTLHFVPSPEFPVAAEDLDSRIGGGSREEYLDGCWDVAGGGAGAAAKAPGTDPHASPSTPGSGSTSLADQLKAAEEQHRELTKMAEALRTTLARVKDRLQLVPA